MISADSLTLQQKLDALREGFSPEGSSPLPPSLLWALLAVIITVAVLFFLSAIRRRGRGGTARDPQKLFRDAMAFLNLQPDERRLLTRLAQERRLGNPAMLLLSPTLFDEVAGVWLGEHTKRPSAGEPAAIAALRSRVFNPPGRPRENASNHPSS